MKKLRSLSLGAALGALLCFGSASGQQQVPFLPTELFICNFQDGSDMSDLQRVHEDFNEWADEAGVNTFTSYLLMPAFHSDQLTADVIYMNIWNNGEAMGNGVATIAAGDGAAGFGEVLDCGAHQLFMLAGIKPPSDGLLSNGAVFQFTNCRLMDNRNGTDGIEAALAWADATGEAGIQDAQALLFPVAGEAGDADYSFKWITGTSSVRAFGRSMDQFMSAGLVQTRGNMMRNLASCDSQRIYNSVLVRESTADS